MGNTCGATWCLCQLCFLGDKNFLTFIYWPFMVFHPILILLIFKLKPFCLLSIITFWPGIQISKVGRILLMVVVSMLPHAEIGWNDHRERAPQFILILKNQSIANSLSCWIHIDICDINILICIPAFHYCPGAQNLFFKNNKNNLLKSKEKTLF